MRRSREARMEALEYAQVVDSRRQLADVPFDAPLADAKAAAKDARDASRRGERRVGGVWVPEEDVPGRDEL